MWQEIIQYGITPVVTAIITAYSTIKASQYHLEKTKKDEKVEEPLDLHDDITPQIKEICAYVGQKFGAIRCDYWVGHNGTKSISGFHMTKISMLCEWVSEKTSETLHLNQNLPTQTFQRNMMALANNKEGYIQSHEYKHRDQLSLIIRSFGVETFVAFKTFSTTGQWEGLFTLGFEEKDKELTEKEIAQIRVMADRIGAIMCGVKYDPYES